MKPVQRNEVLGLADYETIRERFRARVIEEKRARRVAVGDKVSAVFENHDTVLLQIQEMLRTERITREAAIQHEIDTYNEHIPGQRRALRHGDDRDRRQGRARSVPREGARLRAARGALVVDGEKVPARWEKTRELEDRASAVNYLRFSLSPKRRRPRAREDEGRPRSRWSSTTRSYAAKRRVLPGDPREPRRGPRARSHARLRAAGPLRGGRRGGDRLFPALSSATATRRWRSSSTTSRGATCTSSATAKSACRRCTSSATSRARSATATWRGSRRAWRSSDRTSCSFRYAISRASDGVAGRVDPARVRGERSRRAEGDPDPGRRARRLERHLLYDLGRAAPASSAAGSGGAITSSIGSIPRFFSERT